jgi:hypothetical protein
MTAGLYGKYEQRKPKDTCEHCGQKIELTRFGKHYKWVTSGQHWKCDGDPAQPVRAHRPRSEYVEAADS